MRKAPVGRELQISCPSHLRVPIEFHLNFGGSRWGPGGFSSLFAAQNGNNMACTLGLEMTTHSLVIRCGVSFLLPSWVS